MDAAIKDPVQCTHMHLKTAGAHEGQRSTNLTSSYYEFACSPAGEGVSEGRTSSILFSSSLSEAGGLKKAATGSWMAPL